MDVLYQTELASVQDVMEQIPKPPTYSAVRALLRILEEKGHVVHEQDGPRYLYRPKEPRQRAVSRAFNNLVSTFFSGSKEKAMTALLEMQVQDLGEDELDRLSRLIEDARREGR